jgi:hypothetical protein
MVPVLAAPAAAAPLNCEVTVVDVTAIDIQEDDRDEADGVDEIWVRVGGKWFPSFFNSITFVPGQTRSASELNDPKATLRGRADSLHPGPGHRRPIPG